MTIIGVYSQ